MTLASVPGVHYWAHNDSGHAAVLFGLDRQLQLRRRVRLAASLRDPEDMTRFQHAGQAYLLIADVGDNRTRRAEVQVIWFPEPQGDAVTELNRLSFSYPDGPRDVEAVSVDPQSGQLLLLSKREPSPHLYALDFLNAQTQARLLGKVHTLPPPRAEDLAADPRHGAYSSQPTGMSIDPSGKRMVISTYARPYLYRRGDQQTWHQALEQPALAVPMQRLEQAEAVSWDHDNNIIVLSEGHPTPWARARVEPKTSTVPTPLSAQ